MLTDNSSPVRSPKVTRSYAQLPRFQRVKVSVLGRYMLADRREFPCQVLEMSPGDAAVIAPVSGSCSVAMVRIREDFPAPLGPNSPNIPLSRVSDTLCKARTPFG